MINTEKAFRHFIELSKEEKIKKLNVIFLVLKGKSPLFYDIEQHITQMGEKISDDTLTIYYKMVLFSLEIVNLHKDPETNIMLSKLRQDISFQSENEKDTDALLAQI